MRTSPCANARTVIVASVILLAGCGGQTAPPQPVLLGPSPITLVPADAYVGTWSGTITDDHGTRAAITLTLEVFPILRGSWTSTLDDDHYKGGDLSGFIVDDPRSPIGPRVVTLVMATTLICPAPFPGLPPLARTLTAQLTGTTNHLSGVVMGFGDCSALFATGAVDITNR